jgi:quercetin dioxygenase-like cupin family protein
MPRGEVLLLEFGLREFRRVGLTEFWVANEERAGYCGKFLFLFDGQTCPEHRHEEKKETFCALRGRVEVTLDGKTRHLEPGDVLAVAPGTRHRLMARGDALLLEVSSPCLLGDNLFEDERIGRGGVI